MLRGSVALVLLKVRVCKMSAERLPCEPLMLLLQAELEGVSRVARQRVEELYKQSHVANLRYMEAEKRVQEERACLWAQSLSYLPVWLRKWQDRLDCLQEYLWMCNRVGQH